MKRLYLNKLIMLSVGLLLSALPVIVYAETAEVKNGPPPVSQPLVTEGSLAVALAAALDVGSAEDYVSAESDLGNIGITPRNGWIADYPVTPDIVNEVRLSVAAAADDSLLSFSRDDALRRFDEVANGMGLTVRAYLGDENVADEPATCENYPNPGTINEIYSDEGPPIVTYYCPPPDYYYEYDWVPYPFWWTGFWFPGFFVLRDFDRYVSVHGHFRHFSNHFNDVRRQRMFRIDPLDRFKGRTFAGIGGKGARNFISTGVPHSPRAIFNTPRGPVSGRSGFPGREVQRPPNFTGVGIPHSVRPGGMSGGVPAGGFRIGGARSGGPAGRMDRGGMGGGIPGGGIRSGGGFHAGGGGSNAGGGFHGGGFHGGGGFQAGGRGGRR